MRNEFDIKLNDQNIKLIKDFCTEYIENIEECDKEKEFLKLILERLQDNAECELPEREVKQLIDIVMDVFSFIPVEYLNETDMKLCKVLEIKVDKMGYDL